MWQYIDLKKCQELIGDPTRLKNLNKLIKAVPRNGTFPSSPISDPWTLRTISPASKTFKVALRSANLQYMCIKTPCTTSRSLMKVWRVMKVWRSKPSHRFYLFNLRSSWNIDSTSYLQNKKTPYKLHIFFSVPCWLEMRVLLCGCGYHSAHFSGQVQFASSEVNGAFRVKMLSERRKHNRRIAIIWQESE